MGVFETWRGCTSINRSQRPANSRTLLGTLLNEASTLPPLDQVFDGLEVWTSDTHAALQGSQVHGE